MGSWKKNGQRLRTSTARGPADPPAPSPSGIPIPKCSFTGAHLPSGSNLDAVWMLETPLHDSPYSQPRATW